MHCELVPLEEFLAEDAETASDYELFPSSDSPRDTWKELTDAIIPKSTEDVLLGEENDFQPFTTQTQSQILLNWRSEFETPVIPRVNRAPLTSPKTPVLFNDDDMLDFDELEEDELHCPGQRAAPGLSQSHIISSSLVEEAVVAFTTAGGKAIPPPSPASRKRASDLLGLDNVENEVVEDRPETMIRFVGFSTASGKKIASPSRDAKNKAEALLRSVGDHHHHPAQGISVDADRPGDNSPLFTTATSRKSIDSYGESMDGTRDAFVEAGRPPLGGFVGFPSFSTASGKKIKSPSKESVERVKSLIRDIEPEKTTDLPCFSTASGKRIKSPSKESVERVKSLIMDIEPEKAPDLPSFSTASGKRVNSPSSKALEAAEKTLSELTGEGGRSLLCHKLQFSSSPGKKVFSHAPATATKAPSPHVDTRHNGFRPFKPPSVLDPLKSPPPPPPRRAALFEKLAASPLQAMVAVNEGGSGKKFDLEATAEASSRCQLSQFSQLLRVSTGVRPRLKIEPEQVRSCLRREGLCVPEKWIDNHLYWIRWKLASYSRLDIPLGTTAVDRWCVNQLLYRYEREINRAQRSILKRVVERDDSAAAQFVVFVSSIERQPEESTWSMAVSDGWYSVKVAHDAHLERLIEAGVIKVGMKLRVAMAQVVSEEACDILEADERGVKLKLSGNAVRPARWHERLGKRKSPMFTVSVASLDLEGGPTACVHVVILRRFPTLYTVEWESGKRKSCGQDEFDELKVCEHSQDPVDRVASVRMSVKIKVADCCGAPRRGCAIITLWDSNPETCAKLTEGTQLKFVALKPTIRRKDLLYLSSTRVTKMIFLSDKIDVEELQRPPLVHGPLLSLDPQEDYDIYGTLLAWDAGHLWILIGERDIKIVAIKSPRGKPLSTLVNDAIYLQDVAFMYWDPRHAFAVFLFTEQSQLVLDVSRHPEVSRPLRRQSPHQFEQAREFVDSLLSSK